MNKQQMSDLEDRVVFWRHNQQANEEAKALLEQVLGSESGTDILVKLVERLALVSKEVERDGAAL